MMRPKMWIVLASGVLITACASKPFTPPTELTRPPRIMECERRCEPPPASTLSREEWDLGILDWGLGCAYLHNECAAAYRAQQ
jgi:hypothetical protein